MKRMVSHNYMRHEALCGPKDDPIIVNTAQKKQEYMRQELWQGEVGGEICSELVKGIQAGWEAEGKGSTDISAAEERMIPRTNDSLNNFTHD